MVIIIKLYPRNHAGLASMVALSFQRGIVGPNNVFSFGTKPLEPQTINHINDLGGATGIEAGSVPCPGNGIDTYQMRI